jgi:hypothetical protein
MNKTAKIFLSAIALYVLGVITCMCFYSPKHKVETIPFKVVSQSIHKQNQQTQKYIQHLQHEKVVLQKKLMDTKQQLNRQNEQVQQLEQSVTFLANQVLEASDSTEIDSSCIALSYYAHSLVLSYHHKDSLQNLQVLHLEKLICFQDSSLSILLRSNIFLQSKVDTLLSNQMFLQSQATKQQRLLAFKTLGNRLLASGLMLSTSVLAYLQIKNLN